MKIKKPETRWLVTTLMCALFLISFANVHGQIKVGAVAGANFNSFGQPGITLGGNVGAFGRYQILDFLEAQAELKYSLIGGGRHDMTRTFETGTPNFSDNGISSVEYLNRSALFHTLELPISARLSLPDLSEGTIVPKFIIGFSYGYVIGAFEQRDGLFEFNNDNTVLLSDLEENISADIGSSNLSYFAGFALDFNLDNGNVFTTEFRFQQGFNNLNDVQLADPQVTETLNAQTFSINFAYQIFSF